VKVQQKVVPQINHQPRN